MSIFGQKLELSVNLRAKSFCLPYTFAYHGERNITKTLTILSILSITFADSLQASIHTPNTENF
ncbi:hypothetical protein THF5H11_70049 [Vibrio jasicida]|uniref:Uncharacterized protein n=1 Tax=Vibrio jasicida TaxID=766224 RepID=A0AAU9QFS5_9VIBR|nr:hypothetical protein THF5H11_70049 [Vibrio jasicida]CAH1562282.1 hypothetical protein THF1C08_120117 [Vibrio jasicida]CAH1570795.1 hypothetical protein THF1A12_110048 [Vibrio jasicida]